jgi:hypothetical protein
VVLCRLLVLDPADDTRAGTFAHREKRSIKGHSAAIGRLNLLTAESRLKILSRITVILDPIEGVGHLLPPVPSADTLRVRHRDHPIMCLRMGQLDINNIILIPVPHFRHQIN